MAAGVEFYSTGHSETQARKEGVVPWARLARHRAPEVVSLEAIKRGGLVTLKAVKRSPFNPASRRT